jgi:hypothetical protein
MTIQKREGERKEEEEEEDLHKPYWFKILNIRH